mmetsp:Transcript_24519/g.43498  ORF Transcript_24519/g.43498 Transcript_24519/m.43498 type:complete len:392 (-) Transcript_24519:84-1259(-)
MRLLPKGVELLQRRLELLATGAAGARSPLVLLEAGDLGHHILELRIRVGELAIAIFDLPVPQLQLLVGCAHLLLELGDLALQILDRRGHGGGVLLLFLVLRLDELFVVLELQHQLLVLLLQAGPRGLGDGSLAPSGLLPGERLVRVVLQLVHLFAHRAPLTLELRARLGDGRLLVSGVANPLCGPLHENPHRLERDLALRLAENEVLFVFVVFVLLVLLPGGVLQRAAAFSSGGGGGGRKVDLVVFAEAGKQLSDVLQRRGERVARGRLQLHRLLVVLGPPLQRLVGVLELLELGLELGGLLRRQLGALAAAFLLFCQGGLGGAHVFDQPVSVGREALDPLLLHGDHPFRLAHALLELVLHVDERPELALSAQHLLGQRLHLGLVHFLGLS